MPKKKKSKKTNPRKSFQTAKVGAGEGSDVSNNITRNNKDQKHGPENNYKQGAKSSGNLEIRKFKNLRRILKVKLIKRFRTIIKITQQLMIMRKLLIKYVTLVMMTY